MNIHELRMHNAMTQADLAKAINVSQGTVSLWETGKSRPSMKNLARLAQLFRVDIVELLREYV